MSYHLSREYRRSATKPALAHRTVAEFDEFDQVVSEVNYYNSV
jgi:hypothetical protein